ncbi:MAG: hypothetical protein MJZ05_02995 [Fibrobacter sp.]|nr:hypothetical protein [Fibrobacter sp.]
MKIFCSLVLTIALFFVVFGCSEKETAGNATESNTIGEVESSSSVVPQSSSEIHEIIFTTKPSSENLLGRTVVRVYQEEQGAQGSCTVGEIVFTAAFKIVGRGVLTYSSAQSVASYDMCNSLWKDISEECLADDATLLDENENCSEKSFDVLCRVERAGERNFDEELSEFERRFVSVCDKLAGANSGKPTSGHFESATLPDAGPSGVSSGFEPMESSSSEDPFYEEKEPYSSSARSYSMEEIYAEESSMTPQQILESYKPEVKVDSFARRDHRGVLWYEIDFTEERTFVHKYFSADGLRSCVVYVNEPQIGLVYDVTDGYDIVIFQQYLFMKGPSVNSVERLVIYSHHHESIDEEYVPKFSSQCTENEGVLTEHLQSDEIRYWTCDKNFEPSVSAKHYLYERALELKTNCAE